MLICISAIHGDYDIIKPPPPGVDEAYLYLDWDDPEAKRLGWKVILRYNNTLSNRYLAKTAKCAPQLLGHKEQDILWLDGSMVPTGVDVKELFDLVPEGGVGCFSHRERDCAYKEAIFSALAINRYAGQPILLQGDHYHNEGYPEANGLWELGCIVWRGAQWKIGESWLAEQLTWTSQDQVSFPYVCWKHGMFPTVLPDNVIKNRWFNYIDHQKIEW